MHKAQRSQDHNKGIDEVEGRKGGFAHIVFEALTPEESRELLRLTGKYLDLFRQKAEQYINEAKQG